MWDPFVRFSFQHPVEKNNDPPATIDCFNDGKMRTSDAGYDGMWADEGGMETEDRKEHKMFGSAAGFFTRPLFVFLSIS